ncbi:hypothetical protein GGR50DRAFT_246790 [Xylaria sp. CBS 124048]|nr:hypothetical protein GGR50DRAFT_246790 [Xylaria sp. CBS 124048]
MENPLNGLPSSRSYSTLLSLRGIQRNPVFSCREIILTKDRYYCEHLACPTWPYYRRICPPAPVIMRPAYHFARRQSCIAMLKFLRVKARLSREKLSTPNCMQAHDIICLLLRAMHDARPSRPKEHTKYICGRGRGRCLPQTNRALATGDIGDPTACMVLLTKALTCDWTLFLGRWPNSRQQAIPQSIIMAHFVLELIFHRDASLSRGFSRQPAP